MDFDILELEASIPKVKSLLLRKVRRFRAKKEKKIAMQAEKERIKKLANRPRQIVVKKNYEQVIGLLEHDVGTRLSLSHVLSADGYKTKEFSDVKSIIEYLKDNTMELIICDLVIPIFSNITNGQKLLQCINSTMSKEMGQLYMDKNDTIPIRVPVIVTIDKDKFDLQQDIINDCLKMGVTGYAIKPIGLNSPVIKKIEEIIKLNHISGKVYTSVMSVDYNIARSHLGDDEVIEYQEELLRADVDVNNRRLDDINKKYVENRVSKIYRTSIIPEEQSTGRKSSLDMGRPYSTPNLTRQSSFIASPNNVPLRRLSRCSTANPSAILTPDKQQLGNKFTFMPIDNNKRNSGGSSDMAEEDAVLAESPLTKKKKEKIEVPVAQATIINPKDVSKILRPGVSPYFPAVKGDPEHKFNKVTNYQPVLLQSDIRELEFRRCADTPSDDYLSKGYEQMKKNQLKRAIQLYLRGIKLVPKFKNGDPVTPSATIIFCNLYFAKSMALFKMRQTEEAIADMTTCLKYQPNNAAALYNRGIMYSHVGKFNESIDDFTVAIQNSPDDIDCYKNRALVYRRLGFFVEAQTDYNIAKQLQGKICTMSDLVQNLIRQKRAEREKKGDIEVYDASVSIHSQLFEGESDLIKALRKKEYNRTNAQVSYIVIFLSNINYIAKSPKDAQETIAQHCVFKTFHTGECICRAGQIPDYFGIIVNGRVDVIPPNFNNIVINVLLANDVYGDSELLLGTSRNADLIVKEETQVVMISKLDYNKYIREFAQDEIDLKVSWLERCHALECFNKDQLLYLACSAAWKCHKKRTRILIQGQPSTCFHILLKGSLDIMIYPDYLSEIEYKFQQQDHALHELSTKYEFHHTLHQFKSNPYEYDDKKLQYKKNLNDLKQEYYKTQEKYQNASKRQIKTGIILPPSFCGEMSVIDPWNGIEPATIYVDMYAETLAIDKLQIHYIVKSNHLENKIYRLIQYYRPTYENCTEINNRLKFQKKWNGYKKEVLDGLDKRRLPKDSVSLDEALGRGSDI